MVKIPNERRGPVRGLKNRRLEMCLELTRMPKMRIATGTDDLSKVCPLLFH